MLYYKKILSTLLLLTIMGCSETNLNPCSITAEDMFGCECEPEYTDVIMWELFSFIFDGNDGGGITGLNTECAIDAPSIGIPAGYTYRAIISDSTWDARDIMNRCSGPIRNAVGTTVTNTWADYFDPNVTLANPVENISVGNAWTGMDANGNPSANNCNDWTSDSNTDTGNLGDLSALNRDRFHNTTLSTCNVNRAIVCVAYRN